MTNKWLLPSVRFENGPCCRWMGCMLNQECIIGSPTMDDYKTLEILTVGNGKEYIKECKSCGQEIKLIKSNGYLDLSRLIPRI